MWSGGRKEGDQSGGSGGAFGLTFLEASTMGPAGGCGVGLWGKAALERGLSICAPVVDRLGEDHCQFERSGGDPPLRGGWINESGVEGQGMVWI